MKRLGTFLSIVIVSTCAAFAQNDIPAAAQKAMNAIDAEKIRATVKYLSDDALQGRGTGQKGGDMAADWIAAQFKSYGLAPAGEHGTYFQKIDFFGVTTDPKQTKFSFVPKSGPEMALKFADDYVANDQTHAQKSEIDAPLVFVGYGINAPEYNWDDYKGTDVKGKMLLMLVNEPPSDDPNFFKGRALTYYGRWTYKYEEAARRGAVGVILVHKTDMASYPWEVVRNSWGSWRFDIARQAGDSAPFLKFRSWVTDTAAQRIMKLAGHDLDDLRTKAASRDFQPVSLNLKGKLDLKSEVKRVQAPNVAGILPGSDPKLRDQYVVYSAHWDHFGVGAPDKTGDTIYNGALDNATGVASVLAIAEALSSLPPAQRPRRSSLFLFP